MEEPGIGAEEANEVREFARELHRGDHRIHLRADALHLLEAELVDLLRGE